MKDIQLYQCMLSAPGEEQLAEATEHLRYWPYVKAYYRFGSQGLYGIALILNIGEVSGLRGFKLLVRAQELIYLCLRQYGVRVSFFSRMEGDFIPYYKPDLFLRPDECLKTFAEFIDELDGHREGGDINHSISRIKKSSAL